MFVHVIYTYIVCTLYIHLPFILLHYIYFKYFTLYYIYIWSVLGVHWKDWCWSWNSNTLATWCRELTHLKRPWCWERLGVGGEGDNRGWDGWMASPTQWTWVWVDSGSWWRTGRPGVLRFMGSQRVEHNWVNELNWTDIYKVHITLSVSWIKIASHVFF